MNNTATRLCLALYIVVLAGCSGGSSSSTNNTDVASASFVNASQADSSDSESLLCNPTEFETELLSAINTIRQQARACGSNHMTASPAVTWSCQLESAAAVHSIDMSTNNFFSHTGSDGLKVNHRVDETNYSWSQVAENIAAGYPGIDLVMDAWLASPAHCETLMKASYEEVGVSVEIPESADYSVYWTLVMGRPTN